MTIRSIAVDDEPFALDVISIHAAKVPELDLMERFTDPFKALEYLKNNPVDLIFLDINMPGLSGMELVSRLKCPPRIVFTSYHTLKRLKKGSKSSLFLSSGWSDRRADYLELLCCWRARKNVAYDSASALYSKILLSRTRTPCRASTSC